MIKIVIAAAIMIYLAQKFRSINFSKIFTRENIPVMGIVFLLTGLNFMVQLKKWKSVFTDMLGELSNKKIAASFFVGVAAGSFTPGRFGEYFGRSLMIKEFPTGEVISASIVDKLANMFILVFSGLFSTIWFLSFTKTFSSKTIYSLVVLLVFLLGILLYSIFRTKAAAYVYKRIEKLRLLKKMFFHLQVLKRTNNRTVFIQLLYSFLLYGIIALQYGFLTSAFANKPLESAFFLCGILTLFVKSFIPSISFGDLGIRESASIFFISAIGLPAEVGFLSAFSIFLFNILLPSVIGLILLLTTKR
ncbi:MAG: lysylphosphatidylglycerol synthase transmembrane domain-containing protein [Ignavibacteria bacterium]|nr:lysylphosphatidylglycerol synthase transmembrane domain-containing protein [Ignavibacteria bacterium]